MEIDYSEVLTEKELKICRTFMNAKIDIFQDTNAYVYRGKKSDKKFCESYEFQLIQNDAACIASTTSNLLFYTLTNRLDNIHQAKRNLRKIFTQKEIDDRTNSSTYVEKEYKKIKIKLIMKKLESDSEYIKLCEFIDSPEFDNLMRTNYQVLRTILTHQYLVYHPKFEQIKEKYGRLI